MEVNLCVGMRVVLLSACVSPGRSLGYNQAHPLFIHRLAVLRRSSSASAWSPEGFSRAEHKYQCSHMFERAVGCRVRSWGYSGTRRAQRCVSLALT